MTYSSATMTMMSSRALGASFPVTLMTLSFLQIRDCWSFGMNFVHVRGGGGGGGQFCIIVNNTLTIIRGGRRCGKTANKF